MKLHKKKIIAREFLIFSSLLVLTIIFFLSTYIYNYSVNKQLNKLTNKCEEFRKYKIQSSGDDKIKIQIKNLNSKKLEFNEKVKFSFICLFVLSTIAFPIRYLFLMIKWSIRTTKMKE